MGFGILFIGFFLLLNLTYYGYTDVISALVMLLSFYKLQMVNKYFRFAMIPTGLFAAVGAVELFEAFASTFGMNVSFIIDYTAPSRYIVVGFAVIFMLKGIENVAGEVGAESTRLRARYLTPFAYVLYALAAVFEYPALGTVFTPYVMNLIATILLLLIFAHMCFSLITIYSAYMHICMPEDVDNDPKNTQSKFGFVNKFKAHEEKQTREYAEYRMEKAARRAAKRKGKKK